MLQTYTKQNVTNIHKTNVTNTPPYPTPHPPINKNKSKSVSYNLKTQTKKGVKEKKDLETNNKS